MKKYQVIYDLYKESILSGILKYGDRVDSIRECVKKMNVSKTTVENAYNKLVLDGFISSQEKVGYVVSMNPERIILHQEILDYSSSHKEKSYDYDFRIQSVSFDSFETTIWKRYMKGVLNDKRLMSSYGLAQGEYGLRQALCKYVYQNRNILCFPEQMVIGSNYQSLLYIFCGMLDKSKVIGLSTLVDDQAKQVFLSYGFHVEYLNPDSFVKDIQRLNVDVVYVNTTCFTSNRQSMSERIREELVYMGSTEDFIQIQMIRLGEQCRSIISSANLEHVSRVSESQIEIAMHNKMNPAEAHNIMVEPYPYVINGNNTETSF